MFCFELSNNVEINHSYFCNININIVTVNRIIVLCFIIYVFKSFNILLIDY
uniref:Uncharacterized protein n=2 Tax=Grateloupia TaxID=31454 RepID=A0A6F8UNC8_9FLOR|nr:hypothetical protein Grafi_p086 [Grateloupia filicina]AWD77453.1 hypothetical protein Grafi_p086 [Grateloupia filicina]BCB14983.1 hypothetical protein [Grateloupia asiatica]